MAGFLTPLSELREAAARQEEWRREAEAERLEERRTTEEERRKTHEAVVMAGKERRGRERAEADARRAKAEASRLARALSRRDIALGVVCLLSVLALALR